MYKHIHMLLLFILMFSRDATFLRAHNQTWRIYSILYRTKKYYLIEWHFPHVLNGHNCVYVCYYLCLQSTYGCSFCAKLHTYDAIDLNCPLWIECNRCKLTNDRTNLYYFIYIYARLASISPSLSLSLSSLSVSFSSSSIPIRGISAVVILTALL